MLNEDNLNAGDIRNAGMTRKALAEEMGITYQLLCNRMCDFCRWPDEDLKRARHILAAAHRKKYKAASK